MSGPTFPAGTLLGDTYRILRPLFSDETSEVYEAAHVRLPARLWVKALRPGLAARPAWVASFHREAEVLSRLSHPALPHAQDFNRADNGLPYFTLESLEGVDLASRLREVGAFPLEVAVTVVNMVAGALDTAHRAGFCHGRLRPSCIVLVDDGSGREAVKVWGIGQADVEGGAGIATDQTALAGIAYEMLAGHPPFAGLPLRFSSDAMAYAYPASLAGKVAGVTDSLDALLRQSLSRHPDSRAPSVAAFATAFAAAAAAPRPSFAGAPPPAEPESPWSRPPIKLVRRRATTARLPGLTPHATNVVRPVPEPVAPIAVPVPGISHHLSAAPPVVVEPRAPVAPATAEPEPPAPNDRAEDAWFVDEDAYEQIEMTPDWDPELDEEPRPRRGRFVAAVALVFVVLAAGTAGLASAQAGGQSAGDVLRKLADRTAAVARRMVDGVGPSDKGGMQPAGGGEAQTDDRSVGAPAAAIPNVLPEVMPLPSGLPAAEPWASEELPPPTADSFREGREPSKRRADRAPRHARTPAGH